MLRLALDRLQYQILRIDGVKTADVFGLVRRRLPLLLGHLPLVGLVHYAIDDLLRQCPVLLIIRDQFEVLLVFLIVVGVVALLFAEFLLDDGC